MALRTKTVEYVFDTRLTNLATGTTLATSTRHDFTAISIYLPETASRTFRSVTLELHWRDVFTTVYNVSGWRLGIKLGAVAFNDVDYSPTAIGNTGDHEAGIVTRDVTAYFVSNFTSGSTFMTAQVGVAIATATAANVNNLTAKLIITYEYDDAASTLVKTVRIPIQSHHILATASQVEIGTTGGTNNAPANQIPALDSFLPETGKSYKEVWFEMMGNDGGAATTDINVVYQIDSGATAARAILEQSLSTGCFYFDTWVTKYIDSAQAEQNPYSITTSGSHAFKMASSLASRFDAFGGVMCVTYTYNASSTTIMNSVLLPLDTNPGFVGSTAAADQNALERKFWIEEPTTITLMQSGVILWMQSGGGATFDLLAGSQSSRAYTLTALVNSGGHSLIHRVDHNSGLSLARGENTLTLKFFTGAAAAVNSVVGFAIINYTSGKAAAGEGAHNHSTHWYIACQATSGAQATMNEIATAAQRVPNIPESDYFLVGVALQSWLRFATAINGITLHAEKLSGEFNADGWINLDAIVHSNDGELASYFYVAAIKDDYNIDTNHTGQLDIETIRKYRLHLSTAALICNMAMWLTYHSIYFTVTKAITGSGGGTVTIDLFRSSNDEWLGQCQRSGNGNYTIDLFDSAGTVYAVAREDGTHLGRSENFTAGA